MPGEVRLWRVTEGGLAPLPKSRLDLESRLEQWIVDSIGIIDPELLIIGRQVETSYGGFIDLLCLNRSGDLVIVELKRDATPREVTAQALDYASWVRELTSDDVYRIAEAYFGDGLSLEKAYADWFGAELPEAVNQRHGIMIVASSIDASTERIIKYLSDEFGASVNAAEFQYFREPDGTELIARHFLVEPERVENQSRLRAPSKRRPNLSYDELDETARAKGVHELYTSLVRIMQRSFSRHTTITSLAFTAQLEGSRRTFLSLLPMKSSQVDGLQFQVYSNRLSRLLGVSEPTVEAALPAEHVPWNYPGVTDPDHSGYEGYFKSSEDVDRFAKLVSSASPA